MLPSALREEGRMDRATRNHEGFFERLADFMSSAIGRPAAFLAAAAVVVVWLATGPLANFSNTWQLVINTGTTIVTFLMVFLLGNASNRITESQDLMLSNIFDEEQRLQAEERLIRRLLDRMDVDHIQPILSHLDQQDHQIESVTERILAAMKG
jgi:low affinity Fe/Cu permease